MASASNTPTDADHHRFRAGIAYAQRLSATPLETFVPEFETLLRLGSKFHAITPETRIFEVGSGSGWFEVLCALRGLNCSAIELSPVNLDVAQRLAAKHDVEVDIRLGNIETDSIGVEQYDYVIAASVFEHVRHYGLGLARVYEALRPGGVLYFSSTNKFSPRSGEFPGFPLYGWWPYRARERIRVERQGSAIIESSGIDFNQFTYPGLRRHFRSLGFKRVYDPVEYSTVEDFRTRHGSLRAELVRLAKVAPPAKSLITTFASVTSFICVK